MTGSLNGRCVATRVVYIEEDGTKDGYISLILAGAIREEEFLSERAWAGGLIASFREGLDEYAGPTLFAAIRWNLSLYANDIHPY